MDKKQQVNAIIIIFVEWADILTFPAALSPDQMLVYIAAPTQVNWK